MQVAGLCGCQALPTVPSARSVRPRTDHVAVRSWTSADCFAQTHASRRGLLLTTAALSVSLLLPHRSGGSTNAATGVSVGYRPARLPIAPGQSRVPVSFWYPAKINAADSSGISGIFGGSDAEERPYKHFISVGKIVEVLQGAEVPRAVGWEFQLRAGRPVYVDAPVMSPERATTLETALQQRRAEAGLPPRTCAVIFAHGYLGSRFDMLHLCERLASQGFIVAAPDFAEGLSGAVPLDAQFSRGTILAALIERLRQDFGAESFGIVGHSAGGGTATVMPGPFECGRAAIAGLAPGYTGRDPLLVIASDGDGVVPLGRVVQALPPDIQVAATPAGVNLASAEPAAIAVLMRSRPGARQAAPCHISFLSSESNGAMISLLSPLLPVARALKVPVLDFDTYLRLQDSESVGEAVLPLVEGFFCRNAARA